MVDKDIIEAIAELDESDLKRLKLLIDNKLGGDLNPKKISYRSKDIKCGRESCNSCPHGPYWYAEWTESGKRKTKYLGKILSNNSVPWGEVKTFGDFLKTKTARNFITSAKINDKTINNIINGIGISIIAEIF